MTGQGGRGNKEGGTRSAPPWGTLSCDLWTDAPPTVRDQATRVCLVAPAAVAATAAAGTVAAGLAPLGEAVGAVDGLVAARLEGDLGLLAAAAADGVEHLARGALVAATATVAAAAVAAAAA